LHPRRDADTARLSQSFKARRDIDPVAKDIVALDDDVALVDTDAKLDPALGRQRRVAIGERRLHLGRTAERIDDARKLDQQAVAGGLDDSAPVLGDLRID